MPARPVIAIAGLACETSTFSPARTDAAAFRPQRADQVLSRYRFLHPDRPLGKAAAWRGTLICHALPGGIVRREALEALAGDMIERLRAVAADGELDGLWFDIHGAMCVEGLDDAEAELLGRIRAAVGTQVLVSASMDLHSNVSRELAHLCDLVTCYRTAPHEDELDTKERACHNLVGLLGAPPPRQRPLKAWVPVPVLLAGEQTLTRLGPARHIYAAMAEVEAWPGVLDAAVWVGYAWAEKPRNHAVSRGAQRLARLYWDARADFAFAAPAGSLAECLDAAIHAPAEKRPFFISDSGDNPTAGGAGDVIWSLAKLLAAQPELDRPGSRLVVIYASLPGPAAVATAVAAGVGAEVDDLHAPPLTLTGRVQAIKHGDRDAVTEVVLQVGAVLVILTQRRKPYHKEKDFTDLQLHPRHGADIVVVKIGYLEPQLFDMAKAWMLALTPGGVDQDLQRLGHRRICRPMWPLINTDEEPDLSTRWIPISDQPLRDSSPTGS